MLKISGGVCRLAEGVCATFKVKVNIVCLLFTAVTLLSHLAQVSITLGPAYNEFGYNEHPVLTNTFLCIGI